MHAWWTPTAQGYFSHVTKAKVLVAVRVFASQVELVLSQLKKDRLAAEAQRLAAGSGCLLEVFLPRDDSESGAETAGQGEDEIRQGGPAIAPT